MNASASLLTLFSDTTAPSARPRRPFRPKPSASEDVVVVLVISELSVASARALTVIWPLASTSVSSR